MKLLLIIFICAFVISATTVMAADSQSCHACITEPDSWTRSSLSLSEERFKLYRENNVDMLRVSVYWADIENEEGVWDISQRAEYIRLARKYGFRIKLIMGTIMSPPTWYLRAHPNAIILDENGIASHFTMSYCYPELKSLIKEKTAKLISLLKKEGVWDSIDYIIPTFGPAGEPVYPHPWTMGPNYTVPRYWCYDAESVNSWRKAMKKKYSTIAKANAAWGTDFESFDTMPLLKSGEKPGTYWNDYLTWYRDIKRDFIKWQIGLIKKAAPDKQTLVYVPGISYTQKNWQQAVETGEGDWTIKMMCDSMWLMETALKSEACLQYTGCSDEPEVARLRAWLDSHGYKDAVMWGENAGSFECANHPLKLSDICVKYRLYGLDYTHAHFAFLPADGKPADYQALTDPAIPMTPNPVIMPQLKAAFGIVNNFNRDIRRGKM